jgi:hypothetical protein
VHLLSMQQTAGEAAAALMHSICNLLAAASVHGGMYLKRRCFKAEPHSACVRAHLQPRVALQREARPKSKVEIENCMRELFHLNAHIHFESQP